MCEAHKMINYEESLERFYQVDMLNSKGLKDYVKILRSKITQLKLERI